MSMDREMARRIIDVASHDIVNCPIRFGRTHKVQRRFVGTARSIIWKGPCKRRGGAFVILCDYDTMREQEHKMVLLQMIEDYSEHLLQLKLVGAKPEKKRRKQYDVCRNKTINSSTDLQLYIHGKWLSFGKYMPSKVRELVMFDTRNWLTRHASKPHLSNSTQPIDLRNDGNPFLPFDLPKAILIPELPPLKQIPAQQQVLTSLFDVICEDYCCMCI
jgi:hypothetical protein